MTDPLRSDPMPGSSQLPAYTPTDDEKILAILCHVLTIFFGFIPPLVIYLIKKDESKFVAEHAKESLNFQITITIIIIVLLISIVGILLIWPLAIAVVVFVIIATVKASEKKIYRYPMTIRLIK